MDETIILIKKAHTGDKAARDRLVMENVGLVWGIVRHYRGRGCEMEDLFQIGSIGLMKAIDKFDITFGVKFSTYAVPMIAGEIKRFLRDDGMIKVSRSVKELGIKVKQIRENMIYTLGREPSIDEIAGQLGVSCEEIAACIEAGSEIESLNKPLGTDGDKQMSLMDRIEEKNNGNEKIIDNIVLKELIEGLNDVEREIIIRRYYYNETQSAIAGKLNISQVQVSRMEKKILKQMRDKL